MNPTHGELVERAGRWLRNSAVIPGFRLVHKRKVKCGVVLTEMVSNAQETPDAIGWFSCGYHSILIECKTSRADFFADQKKWRRSHPALGVGCYRYYMTPPGLIKKDELPEKWGLLETSGKVVRLRRIAWRFDDYSKADEKGMLFSALRRIQTAKAQETKP